MNPSRSAEYVRSEDARGPDNYASGHAAVLQSSTVVKPPRGLELLPARELWASRELLYFLVWRDLKVRYKQTALGVAWIVLQPIALTAMFAVVFGRFLSAPSGGLPYSVFVLAGLVPWQLFAAALTRAGPSLVANEHLITKVYFPRVLVPIAAVLSGLIDLFCSLIVLVVLLAYRGVEVSATVLFLPLLVLLTLTAAMGVALLLSALNVRYRDVQNMIPFLSQIWLFATPIAYASTLVPSSWHRLYDLNPMVGVIEGFRWAIGGANGFPHSIFSSMTVTAILLIAGLIYFRRAERDFADVV
jgi:homopolymeric O-antigen transport system permease protein